MSSTVTLNISLNLQIYFVLMKSPRGDEKLRRFLVFVYVSFVLLISICLMKYYPEYSFGSFNYKTFTLMYALRGENRIFGQQHMKASQKHPRGKNSHTKMHESKKRKKD